MTQRACGTAWRELITQHRPKGWATSSSLSVRAEPHRAGSFLLKVTRADVSLHDEHVVQRLVVRHHLQPSRDPCSPFVAGRRRSTLQKSGFWRAMSSTLRSTASSARMITLGLRDHAG